MDNNRHLDNIIAKVKAQQEEVAQNSEAEAKALYQTRTATWRPLLLKLSSRVSWPSRTQDKLLELSKALQQVRDGRAQLLHDCQELLSMKLALDVELTSSCRLGRGPGCQGRCLEKQAHQALSPGLDPQ
uniref:Uncharacterized protein n=1 Tax=Molossus molossus TaxID=27622 RepID=A0A7J8FYT3_MOLMO|nr:hypothetical protein HJG59_008251 [Molossus molossus]